MNVTYNIFLFLSGMIFEESKCQDVFEATPVPLCSSLLSVRHKPPTQAAAQYHIVQFGQTVDNTYTSVICRLVSMTMLEYCKIFLH